MTFQVETRTGFKLLVQLPPGYDTRTRLTAVPDGGCIVIHPDKKPLKVSPQGTIEDLDLSAETDMKQQLEDNRSQDHSRAE